MLALQIAALWLFQQARTPGRGEDYYLRVRSRSEAVTRGVVSARFPLTLCAVVLAGKPPVPKPGTQWRVRGVTLPCLPFRTEGRARLRKCLTLLRAIGSSVLPWPSTETAVGWSELETLQRDINGLLETNRLDWEALVNEPMSSDDRSLVQKAIAARTVDLLGLLHRKWALESA